MAENENSWCVPSARQSIADKIFETMKNCKIILPPSPKQKSIELENDLFERAETQEQYLDSIAELILDIREIRRYNPDGTLRIPEPVPGPQEMKQQPSSGTEGTENSGEPVSHNIQMLDHSGDNTPRDYQCVVCREYRSCYLCQPCFHMVLCARCTDQIIHTAWDYDDGENPMFGQLRCPFCNQDAQEFTRVHMPVITRQRDGEIQLQSSPQSI